MISIYILSWILLIHYLADFVFQTDYQAQNKSKSWKALLSHTATYSLLTFFAWSFIFYQQGFDKGFYIFVVTLICHTITDYFTSRLTTKHFSKGEYHWGFVVVGFDQWLHYLQLILTYYYLIN